MLNEFNVEGNLRYSRTSFDDFLPWFLFERLKIGAAVPFLGTHPLRGNPHVAWHSPIRGQNFHTYHYRLKRTITEKNIPEFCKALTDVTSLDEPITDAIRIPMLSLACKFDQEVMARVLVMRGANLDTPDALGQTPLHYSINAKSFECAKLLMESGADPTQKDSFGLSSIDLAKAKGQTSMLKLLQVAQPFPKLVPLAVRNSLVESARLRGRLLSRLRRLAFAEPVAYPFNDLKGMYTVSLRN
jgi:ankyrin repeat protein